MDFGTILNYLFQFLDHLGLTPFFVVGAFLLTVGIAIGLLRNFGGQK